MLYNSLIVLIAALASASLAFTASLNQNIAVYWGQNSFGNQQRLSYYCGLDNVDVVILSFVIGFPNLSLNFANQCGDTFSDGVLHCSNIGEDIKTCQEAGKLVLLSLGGASGSYGFTSDEQGVEFASVLWNKFGGGSDDERPFDDAIVDGFDFDLENNNQVGIPALGNKLREIFAENPSKKYYLSAAPQCPYPDASTGNLLANVDIDFAFIQFYNNYCNLGASFNWDTWKDFAENSSPNKDIKLYVGLPGATSSAGSGYADLTTVKKYVSDSIVKDSNFGGFMLWDASSGVSNTNSDGVSFIDQLSGYLGTGEKEVTTSKTSTSTTTSSTSTSTSTSSTSTSSSSTSSTSTTTTATSSSSSASSSSSTSSPTKETSSTTASSSSSAAASSSVSLVSSSTVLTLAPTEASPAQESSSVKSTSSSVEHQLEAQESKLEPSASEPPVSSGTRTVTISQTTFLPPTLTTSYVSGTELTVTVAGKTFTTFLTYTNIVLTKYITVQIRGRPTVLPRI